MGLSVPPLCLLPSYCVCVSNLGRLRGESPSSSLQGSLPAIELLKLVPDLSVHLPTHPSWMSGAYRRIERDSDVGAVRKMRELGRWRGS